MTVSAIMGSLRMMAACGPAEILRGLNESLVGSLRGGFVTCLVACIEPNGTITVANAGHLAPYRNGDEQTCDFGLPLGITSDATWGESTLTLAPGDTLTFLSDGVVEAQNAAGELYGFDRTRAISTEPADSIALAASTYGQQDDITVLTLTFTPVAVAL